MWVTPTLKVSGIDHPLFASGPEANMSNPFPTGEILTDYAKSVIAVKAIQLSRKDAVGLVVFELVLLRDFAPGLRLGCPRHAAQLTPSARTKAERVAIPS